MILAQVQAALGRQAAGGSTGGGGSASKAHLCGCWSQFLTCGSLHRLPKCPCDMAAGLSQSE